MEMPEILTGVENVDDTLSPQRPSSTKKATYRQWDEDEEWVDFRLAPHTGHVPSNLSTLVKQKFMKGSGEKRKRKETATEVNIAEAGTAVAAEVDAAEVDAVDDTSAEAVTTPIKRAPDNRKWCFRCTTTVRVQKGTKTVPMKISRIDSAKPRKTINFCMRCRVALCEDCFRPWHTYKRLPKTPSSAEVVTQEDEGDGTTLALV
jgi:hypothetical protein